MYRVAALRALPALAQGAAPAGAYVSDKTHTTIQWQGLHNGLSWYTGRFTNFDIQLTFNPADVTKSKVTATIDPKSIETDYTRTRPAGNTTDFNNELAVIRTSIDLLRRLEPTDPRRPPLIASMPVR